MTALLSGVVLVLILCHTPKTIVNTYESYQVYTPVHSPVVHNFIEMFYKLFNCRISRCPILVQYAAQGVSSILTGTDHHTKCSTGREFDSHWVRPSHLNKDSDVMHDNLLIRQPVPMPQSHSTTQTHWHG